MFSLRINMIGCDEQIVPAAARKYLQRWAVIDDDFPSVAAIQNSVLMKEGETRLLIMYVSGARDLPELKRLNSTYPRYAILAVLDAGSESSLMMQCMRAGALQVLQAPVRTEDLQEALDCISAKHEGLSTLAKVVAVTGALGGCGGTTVSVNLGYELAQLSQVQCILMELSMRMGKLANYLDITPEYTTPDLVADINRVDSYILQAALTEVSEHLSALVGPYNTIQSERVDLENTMKLILLVRHLSAWLVLDVPCTYDELYFRSLLLADQIVIVADQSVAAIRSVQLICDSLAQRRPIVAINRYNPEMTGLPLERIKEFLPNCDVCKLASDQAVAESTNNGKPVRLQQPNSRFLTDIDALIRKLVLGSPEEKKESESIFRRLGRVLSLS